MGEHRNITGINNHEPKGVENASSGEVYVADGAGTGTWQSLDIPTGIFIGDIKTFTASGTWNKPTDLFAIKVTCIGAGGGTGFSVNGASASFGSHCSATGGKGGTGADPHGTGTDGDQNLTGTAHGVPGYALYGEYGWGDNAFDELATGNVGGGGGAAVKWLAASDVGSTETITITAGDSGAPDNAVVVVEEYVLV